MSWEATAYVKKLDRCPDGAPLAVGQKLLLFVLADYHNTAHRRAWPSLLTLAQEALCSRGTVRRHLEALEHHGVIRQIHPPNQGAGHRCEYIFVELDGEKGGDDDGPLPAKKGVKHEPLSACKRGPEGIHFERKRGSEGVHLDARNKERTGTKNQQEQNHHACGALSSWLAIKEELQQALPAREWKLWCRPAYLLKVLGGNRGDPGGHLLVSLPPSNAIMRAAQARLAMLRGLALARGFGLSLTRYPDDHDRERLRTDWPEFYAQMFGVQDADSEAST